MIDELILLYRGMGQHDKALDVRVLPPSPPPFKKTKPAFLLARSLSCCATWLTIPRIDLSYHAVSCRRDQQQVIVKQKKDFAQEAKQYCLDNVPPCKPGDVPTSLFTDLLDIYFNSADPKYACI
jgi:hypothetical protein